MDGLIPYERVCGEGFYDEGRRGGWGMEDCGVTVPKC
jgi:hypothetical protein